MRQVPPAADGISATSSVRPPPPWSAQRRAANTRRHPGARQRRSPARPARRWPSRRAAAPRHAPSRRGGRRRARHRRRHRSAPGASRPCDAAVGQVEGGLREVEEAIVALRIRGDDEGRLEPVLALGEARHRRRRGRRAPVFAVPRTSLLRARRRTSTPSSGAAVPSERTATWSAVLALRRSTRPRSETTNHCVATSPYSSAGFSAGRAVSA